MPVCVPLNDLRRTNDFLNLVNLEGEVVVTNNGQSAFRCICDSKEEISLDLAREKLQSRMELAQKEVKEGKYSPFDDVVRSLR